MHSISQCVCRLWGYWQEEAKKVRGEAQSTKSACLPRFPLLWTGAASGFAESAAEGGVSGAVAEWWSLLETGRGHGPVPHTWLRVQEKKYLSCQAKVNYYKSMHAFSGAQVPCHPPTKFEVINMYCCICQSEVPKAALNKLMVFFILTCAL